MAKKTAPVRSSKARENQLISLAADLAEKKLKDGSASSQLICTLLNFANTKHKLEIKKLESDIALSEVKQENIKQAEKVMELYESALDAFRNYQGSNANNEDDDYEED